MKRYVSKQKRIFRTPYEVKFSYEKCHSKLSKRLIDPWRHALIHCGLLTYGETPLARSYGQKLWTIAVRGTILRTIAVRGTILQTIAKEERTNGQLL